MTNACSHCSLPMKHQKARPHCHLLAQTGTFVWCCRCGARAAKFAKKLGEPCVGHPRSQEHARSIRLLSSGWHPKDTRFLGSPKLFTAQAWARWRQSYQGDNCDRAGLAELRQTVIRSAWQRPSRQIPMTRNTCSSRREKSSGAGSVGRASNGTARQDCC